VDHIHEFAAQEINMLFHRLMGATLQRRQLPLHRPCFHICDYWNALDPEAIKEMRGTVLYMFYIRVDITTRVATLANKL
jgi:hypothetical protein